MPDAATPSSAPNATAPNATAPNAAPGAFDQALAGAMTPPDLAPDGAPPSITLAAALGLAPPLPVGMSGEAPATAGDAAAVTPVGAPAVGGDWKSRLPAAGRKWADQIEAAATKHGVDPRLLASLVKAESGFRQEARSHAGAIGLAQLMPGTARGLGVDPYNAVQNLEGGAKFLKAMLDQFGRNDLALAAYNAGPARVQRAGGIPNIRETQAYVPKVLRFYEQLR